MTLILTVLTLLFNLIVVHNMHNRFLFENFEFNTLTNLVHATLSNGVTSVRGDNRLTPKTDFLPC